MPVLGDEVIIMRAYLALASLVLAVLQPSQAVKVSPDFPPVSIPYNVTGRLTGIQELPLEYVSEDGVLSLVGAPGCAPQQVNNRIH